MSTVTFSTLGQMLKKVYGGFTLTVVKIDDEWSLLIDKWNDEVQSYYIKHTECDNCKHTPSREVIIKAKLLGYRE